MWITSPAIWLLFFRIGFLAFTCLCTLAGLVLLFHVLAHLCIRTVTKFYAFSALLEASRELQRQGKAPKFQRYMRWVDKRDRNL